MRPSQAVKRLLRSRNDLRGLRSSMLPWGISISVDPAESVGRSIWRTGIYELVITEVLWRLIDPGDCTVDVGANIGYMTSILALRTGPDGEVWCFEPHPGNFRALLSNLEGWRTEKTVATIRAYSLALADVVGSGCLVEAIGFDDNRGLASLAKSTTESWGVAAKSHTVSLDRLDAILGDRNIGLVKIDVEGGELRVLQGAARFLESGRIRDIVFEDFDQPMTPVMKYLSGYGYEIFGLRRSLFGPQLSPIVAFRPGTPWESPNYLATLNPARALARLQKRGWSCLR